MSNSWDESAAAWIADMGDAGDYGRRYVLDAPMLERVRQSGARRALDVGCGEGRFCRLLAAQGISSIGIDPTPAFIARAREAHPEGDYRLAHAEHLPFANGRFDLVVAYLCLIDIADLKAAIAEMARVLQPGGRLLVANLTSFNSAAMPSGWTREPDGTRRFIIDNYLDERSDWVSWRGIRIRNWHRPLSAYMKLLLGAGLALLHFDEPAPVGGDPAVAARYRRVPYFLIMEWQKPMNSGWAAAD